MDVGVGWPDEPCERQCHSLSEGTKVTEFNCGQASLKMPLMYPDGDV